MNIIARLLQSEDILVDLKVASKAELFDAVGRHMERVHGLHREWVSQSLSRREKVGSTALGQGVAIPHARVAELNRIQPAYVRIKSPIAFDAPDGAPVSDVLVLLVPKAANEEHLRILAEATRLFSDHDFRQRLRQGGSAAELKRIFEAGL